jgi:hypothetical protein
MDEFQLVRELFTERPAPRPEVVAEARARLSASPRPPAAGRKPRGRRPRRHALVRVWLPASAIAVVAAVLTAVMIPAGPVELAVYQPPAGAAGARAGTAAAGKRILLTVARTVSQAAAPATGRYYVAPAIVGNFLRVGARRDRYVILELVRTQQWASNSNGGSPSYSQALNVQLASAADLAAWRRAGSPTTWSVGQDTSIADPLATNGFGQGISAGPGPLRLGMFIGNPAFDVGGKLLSARALRALPANPAKLKALLLAGYAPTLGEGDPGSYLFQAVPDVLTYPVTPAVRSALYQLLATLPGVRSLGQVRDVGGQTGVAVAITGRYTHCGQESGGPGTGTVWTFSSCVIQQRLVINPVTGLPLAQELRYVQLPPGQSWSAPGGLFSYQLFGNAHWTNASPPGN